MKKYIFPLALLVITAGCIPLGEPPKGNITENTATVPRTPEQKREQMITELTAALFSFIPGGAMQFRADRASAPEMNTVINECAKITGITHDRNSPWQLYSYYTADEWIVDLIHGEKVVHSVRIKR